MQQQTQPYFTADPPDVTKIPQSDILGVTGGAVQVEFVVTLSLKAPGFNPFCI
jgi:hypothetical protein